MIDWYGSTIAKKKYYRHIFSNVIVRVATLLTIQTEQLSSYDVKGFFMTFPVLLNQSGQICMFQ